MRILIMGGDGMLGHRLLLTLSQRHDVRVTLRNTADSYVAFPLFTPENSIYNIEATNDESIETAFIAFQPEVVINAIGIVKQRSEANASLPSIEINALLPHRLHRINQTYGARLIQLSTDCIFSGRRGYYQEGDAADAEDLYGRTKYLGEVDAEGAITLRTSIIGLELKRYTSLIEWYLRQRGTIKGFTHAIYSGFTTLEMARIIERVIVEHPMLTGVHHVASTPISKYELLSKLSGYLNRAGPKIIPDDSFVCDRSLDGRSFMRLTGYRAPAWEQMLLELADTINLRDNESS